MNKKEMQFKYNMVTVAELYAQAPDDPYFEQFSPKALEGIKRLAESLQRARKKGDLK